MKLSELVKLKIELLQYTSLDQVKAAATVVDNNVKALRSSGVGYDKQITDIIKLISRHIKALDNENSNKVNQIIESIDLQIQEQSSKYFEKGYKSFATTIYDDRNNRKLPMPGNIQSIVLGRIRLYSDWHYPGMEIGPHDGEFTPHLVACDPLYLVSTYREYLDTTMSQFSREYQARIRPYYIGDKVNEKGLADLPTNQFRFIFSWNTFNYLPFDEIEKYLVDIIAALRPGGTFMFSYNNGETYNGARHVESGGMSYVPKSLLVAIAEGYGFELIESFDFEPSWHNISWLEIKKPGKLSTIKAHQTLGIIKNIEQ